MVLARLATTPIQVLCRLALGGRLRGQRVTHQRLVDTHRQFVTHQQFVTHRRFVQRSTMLRPAAHSAAGSPRTGLSSSAAGPRGWDDGVASTAVGELCRSTVRRVVVERQRVELPSRPRPLMPSPERTLPASPPATAPPSWERERRPTFERVGSPAPPGGSTPDASDASVAAVDLERLTDQVVRQIDRRIVAHRERVGRI
jgi:hypothetical protein